MRTARIRSRHSGLVFACLPLFFLALTPFAHAAGPEGGLDSRAWELVSPAEKNGGGVPSPDQSTAGALQAAAGGGAFGYASAASFGAAAGAPPLSQYLARRGAEGWTSANLSPPLLSGTYGGGAYQLFSADLDRALLDNGWRCHDGALSCPAENSPLGSTAPTGYRNLYLRQDGTYSPLITTQNAPALAPDVFYLSLAGATPDLGQIVISTCAKLTADAVEVTDGGGGCDPVAQNLYRWSAGSLQPINLLPGQSTTDPGAVLAAPSGAISADGARLYWRGADTNLYLRQGTATLELPESTGASFASASTEGSLSYFTAAGHLYRFDAAAGSSTDLTPAGGVAGVLAVSADGARVYYLAADGLYLHRGSTATKVAATADPANYPPASATTQLSADGTRLAFLSSTPLITGVAKTAGVPEVYLYDGPAARLYCVSCNATGLVPLGPSSIPPPRAAGEGPPTYRPRALSADGTRLFFDSSDRLTNVDTDKAPDVYEWQAPGAGACAKANGCIGLISNGRIASDVFLDASADGSDVYFATGASLLPLDPGATDVYDARASGGFPEPPPPIPCNGDECQGPPSAPDDPIPGTAAFEGPSDPPVHYPRARCPAGKHRVVRHGRSRCVAKHAVKRRRATR